MAASQFIRNRFKIINEADRELLSNLSGLEQQSLSKLLEFLNAQFDISGGRFSGGNYEQINEVANQFRNEILQSGYRENVIDYVKKFEPLRENTEGLASERNLSTANIGLSNIQRGAQQQTINGLLGSGLDNNLIEPVKQIIFDNVQSNATIADAEQALRQFITGDSERLGHLERYVTQVSRDSISQYDGLMQQRIASEYELDGWSYEGSLIKDSRPQCVRWVGFGKLKNSELESEIQWANTNGSGMVPGTTPDTFGIYRGGYNCRHFATAIRL